MKAKMSLVIAVMLVGIAALPSQAHHSVRAVFDPDAAGEISGTVTSIDWVNPHALVHVEVLDGNGVSTFWALELPAPNALLRRGMGRELVEVGEAITAEIWPALDGSPRADTRAIEFADGERIEFPESHWMSVDEARQRFGTAGPFVIGPDGSVTTAAPAAPEPQ